MTIEITDEMVRETIKRAVQKWNESVGPDEPTLTPSDIFSEDVRDHLTAALPIIEKQMRAALEAPIRELHKPVPMVPGLDDTPVGDETPLTLDQYQEQAKATAVYPDYKADQYLIAGLAGEVGELASLFAKVWRGDGNLKFTHAAAELGDVLWFVAMLAHEIGCNLSAIAQNNLNKLADRHHRGKLKGNGDNR